MISESKINEYLSMIYAIKSLKIGILKKNEKCHLSDSIYFLVVIPFFHKI